MVKRSPRYRKKLRGGVSKNRLEVAFSKYVQLFHDLMNVYNIHRHDRIPERHIILHDVQKKYRNSYYSDEDISNIVDQQFVNSYKLIRNYLGFIIVEIIFIVTDLVRTSPGDIDNNRNNNIIKNFEYVLDNLYQ